MVTSNSNESEQEPPPPAYNLQRPTGAVTAHDAYWDKQRPEDWMNASHFNLEIDIMDPSLAKAQILRVDHAEWFAYLGVHVKNLPQLMRGGFHWSTSNILPERGCIKRNIQGRGDKCGFRRTYHLVDLAEDPEWCAKLEIYTKKQSTLAAFKLSWLSIDGIRLAKGWNWDRELVYIYEAFAPESALNAIYDGMPLEGWWPWPKPKSPGCVNEEKVVEDGKSSKSSLISY